MAGWFSHLGVRTKGRPEVNIPCQIARPTVWVSAMPAMAAPIFCTQLQRTRSSYSHRLQTILKPKTDSVGIMKTVGGNSKYFGKASRPSDQKMPAIANIRFAASANHGSQPVRK